jgi:hypothetical protein
MWAGEEKNITDWLNLPTDARPLALWDSLHDAETVSIRSNLLERTLELEIEIEHLSLFHKLGEGFRFRFHLGGVESARVIRYKKWPGEFSVPTGSSREEEKTLIDEYQSKWREESASWDEFEAALAAGGKQIFCIHDAAVWVPDGGVLALKLCGQLNHSHYHEVFFRARVLKILGNDSIYYSLDEFRKLGESYWANRRSA